VNAAVGGELENGLPELTACLVVIVRTVAYYTEQAQNGERSVPWLGDPGRNPPAEHVLADALCQALQIAGLTAFVELPNVAGGRVDVIVVFQRCRLSIEIKRDLGVHDDESLTNAHGTQAVQYSSSGIPVALLGILELGKRTHRAPLSDAFWVHAVQLEDGERTHALIGFRVQANVDSPSRAS
jgi:hypothetical protein